MTRNEAIEVYFKYNLKASEILRRLMSYDPGKSYEENADSLGIAQQSVYHLKLNYGLEKRHSSVAYKARQEARWAERTGYIKKHWDSHLTITGNANKIGIAIGVARKVSKTLGLKYSHVHVIKPWQVTRYKRIVELHNNGIKDAEIARFFSITRERVSQLLADAKRNGIG